MKTRHLFLFVLTAILTLSAPAFAVASQLTFTGVTGAGSWTNDLGLLTDGHIPTEGTQWSGTPNVWTHNTAGMDAFTFALDGLSTIQDVTVSVDNNDTYTVEYSTDGASWSTLFTVLNTYGDVHVGMETFSSDSGADGYTSGIDFNPVEARYLRIYSISGDNCYSVGEFQAYGASATPIPGAAWLLGSGLIGLVGLRRSLNI